MISQKINRYLALLRSTGVNKSIPENVGKTIQACGMQLEGERQELLAGTAKVQVFTINKDRVNR